MPNKKYYPGYANGSFVAKKQRDPDFYKNLKKQGITPTLPGKDPGGRKLPKWLSTIYETLGNPEDRETYRAEYVMGPMKQEAVPSSNSIFHTIPAGWDALADMLPGTMPKGVPGSMYTEPIPLMYDEHGEVVDTPYTPRSDQDYLDSVVGSGLGHIISGIFPGGREGLSPRRIVQFQEQASNRFHDRRKEAGRASGGGVASLIPGYATGGPPQGTTTYNVNPNIAQPMANMTDRITTESQRQYQPSPNQRLAGVDAATQTANLAQEQYSMGTGPAGTGQAANTFQNVNQQAGNIGNQMSNPMQQNTTDLSGYMSQYTKGVTDPQLDQLREFQQVSGQNLGSQAAGSGNLGGMRQGVQQAQINQDVNQQASNIIGQGQQQAFQSAQQAFQGDRNAQQTGQQNALQAQQLQNQVGQNQMQLGANQQNQQRQRFGDLRNIGKDRQQTQQQSLNLQEQDRMNAMNQERQNINWAQGAYNQLPYQSSVTQTAGGGPQGPTDNQSLLATGVGGLGAYSQFQNNYGNNNTSSIYSGGGGNTSRFGNAWDGAQLGNVTNRSYGGR